MLTVNCQNKECPKQKIGEIEYGKAAFQCTKCKRKTEAIVIKGVVIATLAQIKI